MHRIARHCLILVPVAAYRHVVFNYRAIAEYYAHAKADLQEAMEDSALVIVDFNKAIENGFVALTNEILEQYENDYDGVNNDTNA